MHDDYPDPNGQTGDRRTEYTNNDSWEETDPDGYGSAVSETDDATFVPDGDYPIETDSGLRDFELADAQEAVSPPTEGTANTWWSFNDAAGDLLWNNVGVLNKPADGPGFVELTSQTAGGDNHTVIVDQDNSVVIDTTRTDDAGEKITSRAGYYVDFTERPPVLRLDEHGFIAMSAEEKQTVVTERIKLNDSPVDSAQWQRIRPILEAAHAPVVSLGDLQRAVQELADTSDPPSYKDSQNGATELNAYALHHISRVIAQEGGDPRAIPDGYETTLSWAKPIPGYPAILGGALQVIVEGPDSYTDILPSVHIVDSTTVNAAGEATVIPEEIAGHRFETLHFTQLRGEDNTQALGCVAEDIMSLHGELMRVTQHTQLYGGTAMARKVRDFLNSPGR